MTAFADTSFLCALYREEEERSKLADKIVAGQRTPFLVSSLVLLEFRQSARLQAFRFSRDRTQGFSRHEAGRMLAVLEQNVAAGVIGLSAVDWPQVHALAEKISAHRTARLGIRLVDLLHVATALHLGVREFFTFDLGQKRAARAEGLRVLP